VEITDSARKRDITDADIWHAVEYMIILHEMDGYVMIVGPTPSGRLIEVGINFHAMNARRKFLP